MVPRATAASLERLEKRLLDYVSDGGGGGLVFDYARSWMKGVVGATLSGVVTHQVSRKGSDAEDEEDEGELTLPGRVYYIKPRKLHGGATIKEVSSSVAVGLGFCRCVCGRWIDRALIFLTHVDWHLYMDRCCAAACARTCSGRCTTSS